MVRGKGYLHRPTPTSFQFEISPALRPGDVLAVGQRDPLIIAGGKMITKKILKIQL